VRVLRACGAVTGAANLELEHLERGAKQRLEEIVQDVAALFRRVVYEESRAGSG